MNETASDLLIKRITEWVSCPFCMAPWCATALGFAFIFAPRVGRLFASILASVAMSDFLHRAYVKLRDQN